MIRVCAKTSEASAIHRVDPILRAEREHHGLRARRHMQPECIAHLLQTERSRHHFEPGDPNPPGADDRRVVASDRLNQSRS